MTVVNPRMTPLSSIRSTRRLTAGADRFTRCPISANVALACSAKLGQNAFVGLVQTVHDASTQQSYAVADLTQ